MIWRFLTNPLVFDFIGFQFCFHILLTHVSSKVRINDAEDDSTLDSSYECPKISSDVKTMGQAKYQDLAVGASPCHSRLYFHSKHSKDNGLVKMLDQETRKMIQQRLFWFALGPYMTFYHEHFGSFWPAIKLILFQDFICLFWLVEE